MKKYIKIIIGIIILFAFIWTIPGMWQNGTDYKTLRENISLAYDQIDKVCDSGCKDYPSEWIIPGKELEAENYCLNQCRDKAGLYKQMREAILSDFSYRSGYHKKVGQIYCLLGLNCFDNK